MRKTLLALALFAAPLASQAPELAGLTSIRLRVVLDAKSSIPVPVDPEPVVAEMEARLRAAGFRLAVDGDSIADTWPALVFNVLVIEYRAPTATAPIYIIRYDTGVFEAVRPKRHGSLVVPLAKTWLPTTTTDVASNIGSVNAMIRATALRFVTAFIQARGPIQKAD